MHATAALVSASLALAAVPAAGSAQRTATDDNVSRPRAEVLLVGVWHMADIQGGPNDILSSRRQEELPAVLAALRNFAPTKVALEAAFYRSDAMANLFGSSRSSRDTNKIHAIAERYKNPGGSAAIGKTAEAGSRR